MKLLFAAGDPGGARALLPVARLADQLGHQIACLAHGTLHDEGCNLWQWLNHEQAKIACTETDIIVYATSVADTAAEQLATTARASGKPCLHVLDNWSSYIERLKTLVPDGYAVMDELALTQAIDAGVPVDILHITGHPGIAKLAKENAELPGPSDTSSIFFVSEPAAKDVGLDRLGYDEDKVTRLFISALSNIGRSDIDVQIAPHPREDRELVEQRMENLCAELATPPAWSLVAPENVRATLHGASHVVGMTSILLYEAWLLGRPTLSLQPGLNTTPLHSFSHRQDLIFHDTTTAVETSVVHWLSQTPTTIRSELVQHRNAAVSVLTLAENLIFNHTSTRTEATYA